MNYRKIHNKIIERARLRKYDSALYQNHHIIPRCEDPSSKEMVPLTIKEHYIVHMLRYKMNSNYGNFIAYNMLKGLITRNVMHVEVCRLAGKNGGAKTKKNKSGIFSDDWDRSKETKMRHEDGKIKPYFMLHPEIAVIAGENTKKNKSGIFSDDWDRSKSSKKLWKNLDDDTKTKRLEQLRKSGLKGTLVSQERGANFSGMDKVQQQMIASMGGKIGGKIPMWTNGLINKRSHDSPGDDFYRGITKRHQTTKELVSYRYKEKNIG